MPTRRRLLPLVIAWIVIACSTTSDRPRPGGDRAAITTAPGLAPEPGELSFIPSSIASHLGAANVVIAIDFTRFDLAALTSLIPAELDCTRGLVRSLDIAVIAAGDAYEGYVTGLPEPATRTCLDTIAPMLGMTTTSTATGYELDTGDDDRVSLVWRAGTLVVKQVGHEASGTLSPEVRALIAQVPRDAEGWIASGGFAKYKIEQALVWLTTDGDHWRLTATADGTEPDAARTWLDGIGRGFKKGAAGKGVAIPDDMFKVTATSKLSARLDAAIPTSLFNPR